MKLSTSDFQLAPIDGELEIHGVLASGDCRVEMLARLSAQSDETLQRQRGLAAGDHIVIVCTQEDLPWVDGARYISRSGADPRIWLPTGTKTRFPASILAEAFLRRGDPPVPPLLLLPDHAAVISLAQLMTLARNRLAALTAGARE